MRNKQSSSPQKELNHVNTVLNKVVIGSIERASYNVLEYELGTHVWIRRSLYNLRVVRDWHLRFLKSKLANWGSSKADADNID